LTNRIASNKRYLYIKGNNTTIKRKPTEYEKIFISYLMGKGSISRIYKELKFLNTKRINNLITKLANEFNIVLRRSTHG
jgi:hypothetical protein